MRSPKVVLVLCLFVLLSSAGLAQGSKSELRNDMTIELLGRNLLYSFSYQGLLSENFGLEVGFSALGGSGGSVLFFNGGGRIYAFRGDTSPCLAGGIVVLTSPTSAGPFSDDNSTLYAYLGPGFEYRSSGGFVFRGTVYFLIRDGFFIWPGLQLGIAF